VRKTGQVRASNRQTTPYTYTLNQHDQL